MHWEKIPLSLGGKDVLKEQIDNLDNDIPVRLVRFRQKDGKELLYCEAKFLINDDKRKRL
jgi:hypothetical protein